MQSFEIGKLDIRRVVSPFARWLLAVPLAIAGLYTVWPAVFGIPTEPLGHAISHGLPAIVTGLAATGIWRTHAARRGGEWLALGALAVMSTAQGLEAVSAFTEYPNAGTLHETTSIVSMLAVLGLVTGIVWAIGEALSRREIPAWLAIATFVVLAAVLVPLMIGF